MYNGSVIFVKKGKTFGHIASELNDNTSRRRTNTTNRGRNVKTVKTDTDIQFRNNYHKCRMYMPGEGVCMADDGSQRPSFHFPPDTLTPKEIQTALHTHDDKCLATLPFAKWK